VPDGGLTASARAREPVPRRLPARGGRDPAPGARAPYPPGPPPAGGAPPCLPQRGGGGGASPVGSSPGPRPSGRPGPGLPARGPGRHLLQFAYGWIPAGAGVAVLLLLHRFRHRGSEWTPQAQTAVTGTVALLVLAVPTYAGFFLHATNPQMAVYAAPLAAPF